jgi:ribonuclease BN (tRNA processing enzyme)
MTDTTAERHRHAISIIGAGRIMYGSDLSSGDPFVKASQASASLLIEVGNKEHDIFFFDLGSGALANFTGLKLPVNSACKVFLTHYDVFEKPKIFTRAS